MFRVGLIFSALSVAVLSFLGFDAISTAFEEAKGGVRVVGQATMIALFLAALLFIVQTYIAALLVPGQTEFVGETATNDSFYMISALAGGASLKLIAAVTVALSAAIAGALVAQAATARLLFAMARDGQLPRFLAHVHPVRRVPERAVLLVSGISLRPRSVLRWTGRAPVVTRQLRRAVLIPDASRVGGRLLSRQEAQG